MNKPHVFRLIAYSISILFFSFCACSKRERQQTISNYTFTNTLNEDVTVDFYNSMDDYQSLNNPLQTLKIPVGGSSTVELEALRTYWLDWYSQDFMFHNWSASEADKPSNISFPSPKFTTAIEDDNIAISSRPDISRLILFKGKELSSSWQVDIDGEPELNGTHVFTFRRDYTGEHRFTPQSGNTTVAPIGISMVNVSDASFRMAVVDTTGSSLASVYFLPNGDSASYTGRDTLVVNFNTSRYYNARRQ